jgi:hypothetical protein
MLSPLYGQLSPLRVPTKAARKVSDDADANTYLLAVESADGQELESGVISAVESFITGCKSDGIWTALKASCILAGARTLSGALIPLVGTAPTNANFVSGDYNRETGLLGNGSTKYLNSNRAGNADPQDNVHQAIYLMAAPSITASRSIIGINISPQTFLSSGTSANLGSRCRTSGTYANGSSTSVGFKGQARNVAASYLLRVGGANSTRATPSSGNPSANHFVFSTGASGSFDGRLSFYSIGENLNLAALDTRVSTLMTAIAAAIP